MKLSSRALLTAMLISIALQPTACTSGSVERVVHADHGVEATLRHDTKSGDAVDRGFQHPIEIPKEQLRAILATILVRDKSAGVKPAIDGRLLANVAMSLSRALAEANSSEEVRLTAIRRSRRLGIFTQKFLTSLVAYVQDDQLTISFSRVDWDMSKTKYAGGNSNRLPQPRLGDSVMNFKVIPSDEVEVVGAQVARVALAGDEPSENDTAVEAVENANVEAAEVEATNVETELEPTDP